MNIERLGPEALATLPADILRPAYNRRDVTAGIVHLGAGAFHRAHQAVFIDDCIAAGDAGWGIVAASLRSPDTGDALRPQHGLYTVAERDGSNETLRVVGSLLDVLTAPQAPEALLAHMVAPQTRLVTLTITEKAYLRDANGDLDTAHPDILADIVSPDRPRTAHGFLVEALARRRKAGIAPFTVLSCDNLPANGQVLHRLLVEFARLRSADLADHIEKDVACPSCMVDRIVPATTDADRVRISAHLGVADAWPLVTEPFRQWVIEDLFPLGRPDWGRFGVTMVDNVAPYETMKLRLLNGAHSAIAYLGLLCGKETVADAFADSLAQGFIKGLWADLVPTLESADALSPEDYTRKLAARFANTALKHRTAQIANDGSQKLPQRIVAPTLQRLAGGKACGRLALVLAAWVQALGARDVESFTDPLDRRLGRENLAEMTPQAVVAHVFDATGMARGDAERENLIDIVADALQQLREQGVRALLMRLNNEDQGK